MDERDVDIHAKQPAGDGLCPYCHFALKQGRAMACPRCGAGHHPECWEENGGCAIVGCTARAAATPPAAPPVPPPQAAPASRSSSPVLLVASVVAMLAVAGAAAAVLLTRPDERAAPVATATAVAAAAAATETVTVTNTVQAAPAEAPATAPPPPASTPSTASTPTASSEPSVDRGRLVVGPNYSVRIPTGWNADGPLGVYHQATKATENSYRESRWKSPDDDSTYMKIDYTVGFTGTSRDAIKRVRRDYNKGFGYRERSFARISLNDGREAWRWRYMREQDGVYVEKVDYFLDGCGIGFAVLGVAPADRFEAMVPVYARVVNSLRPRC